LGRTIIVSIDSYRFWQNYHRITGQNIRPDLPDSEMEGKFANTEKEEATVLEKFFHVSRITTKCK
jgi:hypothetical protein